MKIWVYLNGVQQGPYDYNQLQQLPIDATTPVWYDGLPQWTPAGQAPATAGLFFSQQQPPYASQQQYQYANPMYAQQQQAAQQPQRPSSYLVWSILLTVLCCTPFSIAAIVTGAITNSRYNSGDYQGAKSMSNTTEWLIIISIVFAVLSVPLSLILFLL